jgi:hypothetical protein
MNILQNIRLRMARRVAPFPDPEITQAEALGIINEIELHRQAEELHRQADRDRNGEFDLC